MNSKGSYDGQRGFTLIEAVIAVSLLGLVATALVTALAVGVRGSDTVVQRNTALQLARSQVESIKNQAYDTTTPFYATVTPPNGDFQISISASELVSGFLQMVTTTITYPEGTTQLSAYKLDSFPPVLADKPLPPPAPACPVGATCFTYYLHNNPSPPVGNTNAQANLPMDTQSNISYDLLNYDQDRNSDAGLTITKGGSGAGETNLTKYQNWRTTTGFASSFHIQGQVEVHLWGASDGFQLNRRGEVKVFLRHYNGTSYTEIANATLFQNDWQAGFTNFVLAIVEIPSVDYTIPAGDFLEVKLLVGSNTQTPNMWFSYDNVDFESRVYLPTVSP